MNRDPHAWARLSSVLRDARAQRGWNQEQLAERAGVSRRAVQDAESGRAPVAKMPRSIPKIAAALDWPPGSIDAILEGEPSPEEAEAARERAIGELRELKEELPWLLDHPRVREMLDLEVPLEDKVKAVKVFVGTELRRLEEWARRRDAG